MQRSNYSAAGICSELHSSGLLEALLQRHDKAPDLARSGALSMMQLIGAGRFSAAAAAACRSDREPLAIGVGNVIDLAAFSIRQDALVDHQVDFVDGNGLLGIF